MPCSLTVLFPGRLWLSTTELCRPKPDYYNLPVMEMYRAAKKLSSTHHTESHCLKWNTCVDSLRLHLLTKFEGPFFHMWQWQHMSEARLLIPAICNPRLGRCQQNTEQTSPIKWKCLIREGDEVEIDDWVVMSHPHLSANLAPLATSQGFLLRWLHWWTGSKLF